MTTWFTPDFVASHPADVARCQAMIAATSPAGYLGCCAALRDADVRPGLPAIAAPALVVAGQRDVSSTVADAAGIAAAIPGSRVVELPCAHMSVIEERDAITRLLEEWLT
jgi:3-oxoadipate enol-lactonase